MYYVQEGVVNTYAMNFVVLVPASIADLEFSWQSLVGYPVSNKKNIYIAVILGSDSRKKVALFSNPHFVSSSALFEGGHVSMIQKRG